MNSLFRTVVLCVVMSAALGVCGCTEVKQAGGLSPDSDSTAQPTDDHETDSGRQTYVRMPFVSSDAAGVEDPWMDAEDNYLRLQGQWYPFRDEGASTSDAESDGEARCCISGTVSAPSGSNPSPYAGGGFNFCNSRDDFEPTYEPFAIGSCPIVDDLGDWLIGISFEVTGALPVPFELMFQVPSRDGRQAYVPIESAGLTDYFFEDARIDDGDPPFSARDVTAFQFSVVPDETAAVPFDFCIGSVSLLIAE